jgi:lipoate-protein ligase B
VIAVEHWGRLGYLEALERQIALADAVAAGKCGDTLVLVEHPPTITLGRHASEADLVAAPAVRSARGIETVRSDRGGQATYHGPGQLVMYPIVNIARRCLGVKNWVWLLQQSLLDVVASYGATGVGRSDQPGVWVGGAKIASIGLRVARGVSYHGVALNVELDVSGFDCIVPCGVVGARITSLAAVSPGSPTVEDAAARLVGAISRRLEAKSPTRESAIHERSHQP